MRAFHGERRVGLMRIF